jgi:hypothetical protein
VRLPSSSDTRLLLVGIAASVALVAYLVVAFVNTHASMAAANRVAPWTPYHAELVPVRRVDMRSYDVRVNPTRVGSYGVLVPTVVSNPKPGRTYLIGFWLKGSRGGPVAVAVDEFRPATSSVYVVDTTVQATPRWRHFTFKAPVQGGWLGLGMYVQRQNNAGAGTWFALRGPTAALSPS